MNVHAIRAIYTFEMSRTFRTIFQSIATPVITIGSDSHCPMLSPSPSRPRKLSGSRANSARKRKLP